MNQKIEIKVPDIGDFDEVTVIDVLVAPGDEVAEDDPADRMILRRTLERSSFDTRLFMVNDGEQALDYLNRAGAFADPEASPRPDLVIVDLNMPLVDGLQVIRTLRADERFEDVRASVVSEEDPELDLRRGRLWTWDGRAGEREHTDDRRGRTNSSNSSSARTEVFPSAPLAPRRLISSHSCLTSASTSSTMSPRAERCCGRRRDRIRKVEKVRKRPGRDSQS